MPSPCAKSLCSFTRGTRTVTTLGHASGWWTAGEPAALSCCPGVNAGPSCPSGERSRAPLPDQGRHPHFSWPGAETAQLRSQPVNCSRGSWAFNSVVATRKGTRPREGEAPSAHGVRSWKPLEMRFLRRRQLSVTETSSRKVVALCRPPSLSGCLSSVPPTAFCPSPKEAGLATPNFTPPALGSGSGAVGGRGWMQLWDPQGSGSFIGSSPLRHCLLPLLAQPLDKGTRGPCEEGAAAGPSGEGGRL